ncbi:MAG: protein kinase [Proteobacteria bacterium]|nr:protein kinase [Pseudomonadota bacterium]
MPEEFSPARFGKYLLLDKIAAGGMAELHRAKMRGDEGFEKLIAIKKVLPHLVAEKRLIEAFIDEARLAAFLQHENIIRTYDFGRMDQDFFIAMEYLFGKNLRLITDKAQEIGQPLPLPEILHILAAAADGLDYSHKLKDFSGTPLRIIHRDVSPPNIFVTYDGQVKVVDFGVAKAASRNTQTQMGIIKGKLAYMSPEQASGEKLDHRTDVFALGAILYELLTGQRMFSGDTMQVLALVREARYTPPEEVVPGLAPVLCRLVKKACARDLSERYESCGHMLADLEAAMDELSLRPTSRSLGRIMTRLFATEIPVEEEAMRAAARMEWVDTEPEKKVRPKNPLDQDSGVLMPGSFREAIALPEPCPMPPKTLAAIRELDPAGVPVARLSVKGAGSWVLVPGSVLLLGRNRLANHVPVFLFPEAAHENENVKVSRNHCRLFVRGEGVFLRDTSSNGTWVEGQRLAPGDDVAIQHGYVIGVAGILELSVSVFVDGDRVCSVLLSRRGNREDERYILAPGPVFLGNDDRVPIRLPEAPPSVAAISFDPEKSAWSLRTLRGFSSLKEHLLTPPQSFSLGPARLRFELSTRK